RTPGPNAGRPSGLSKTVAAFPVTRRSSLFESSDGNDSSCFDRRRLGLVGYQLAQERNQQYERDADHEAAKTELREKLHVPGIGGERRGAGWLGDHSRKVAGKQRREAGHKHPAAHHNALVLLWRELADHRVSNRHEEQFTNALQHIAEE